MQRKVCVVLIQGARGVKCLIFSSSTAVVPCLGNNKKKRKTKNEKYFEVLCIYCRNKASLGTDVARKALQAVHQSVHMMPRGIQIAVKKRNEKNILQGIIHL